MSDRSIIEEGVNVTDLCSEHTQIFSSKGEMRRLVSGGGVSINKTKLQDTELTISTSDLLNNMYILVQKGKKNYFLIRLI